MKNIICLIKPKYYIEIITDLMTMYGNECSARNCHISIHREHWDAVKYLGFLYLITVLESAIDTRGWGEHVFAELSMTLRLLWLAGCLRRRMPRWTEGVHISINFSNGRFWLVNKVSSWKLRASRGIYYLPLGYNSLHRTRECNKV